MLDRLTHVLTDGAISLEFGAFMFIDQDNFKVLNDTLGLAKNLGRNTAYFFDPRYSGHHQRQRGVVDPSEFIPVAEETGLIVPLGH